MSRLILAALSAVFVGICLAFDLRVTAGVFMAGIGWALSSRQA